MPRPRPGWVPSERELRAQGKALRKIAAEQRKIARIAGVTARNQRKLARIQRNALKEAQKAAQDARREARTGERTQRRSQGKDDAAQPAVQPQALPVLPDGSRRRIGEGSGLAEGQGLPCPRHPGQTCPYRCRFGWDGVCHHDTDPLGLQ